MRRMLRTRTLEVVVVALFVPAAHAGTSDDAATWHSRVYSTSAGLPSPVVYAIQEDAQGYLWLGTALGLVRFDGSEFVKWSTDGKTALTPGSVTALASARDGSLWIGFSGVGGVSRLSNGRLVNFPLGHTVPIVNSVLALLEDRQGMVWCGTMGGLRRFSSGKWEHIGVSHGIPSVGVLSLYEDRSGGLWVGSTAGVFRRVPSQDRFELVSRDLVRAFAQDGDGTIWVAGSERTLKTLTGLHTAQRTHLSVTYGVGMLDFVGTDFARAALLSDSAGNLWVATTRGLWKARRVGGAIAVDRLVGHDGLEDEEVLALAQDREGNIWVGSRGGLRRLFVPDVTVLGTGTNQGFIGSGGAVTTTPDGTVWVGNNDGIASFSRSRGNAVTVRHTMRGVRISGLYGDATGTLWVGTDGAMARLANGRMSWIPVTDGAIGGRVRALTVDNKGDLWFCHPTLARWHHGVVTDVEGDPYTTGGVCGSLAWDSAGRLWIRF